MADINDIMKDVESDDVYYEEAVDEGQIQPGTYEATIVALRISPNKVRIAASLFPIRKTFVAPGFFDPIVLGSVRLRNLLIIIPKDIDDPLPDILR